MMQLSFKRRSNLRSTMSKQMSWLEQKRLSLEKNAFPEYRRLLILKTAEERYDSHW